MRVRVLQAASRANIRTQRQKQFLVLACTAVLLFIGLAGVTGVLLRHAGPGLFFARWEESAALIETPLDNPPTGDRASVSDEWRLVDRFSASRESRGRVFRAGM